MQTCISGWPCLGELPSVGRVGAGGYKKLSRSFGLSSVIQALKSSTNNNDDSTATR